MTEYRLSTRNQVRRALRPLGYEQLRYRRQLRWIGGQLNEHRRRFVRLTPADAREYFHGRTVAFCITPGRSGSQFMAALMDLADTVEARHEPSPCFSWVAPDVMKDPAVATDFWLDLKLPAIKALGTGVYIETSHVFAKGFIEPLLKLEVVPTVLSAGRRPREVAKSFLEKYTIPARTWLGKQWLMAPDAPGALAFPEWRKATDYQLCFWYALEMERRQHDYRQYLSGHGVRLRDVDAHALHDFATYRDVLRFLNVAEETLEEPRLHERHGEMIGERFNKTARREFRFFGDFDELEADVWAVVDATRPDLRKFVADRYPGDATAASALWSG